MHSIAAVAALLAATGTMAMPGHPDAGDSRIPKRFSPPERRPVPNADDDLTPHLQTSKPIIPNPTLYECPDTNGFVGHCAENPCDKAWCDDYYPRTYEMRPESSLNPDHLIAAPHSAPPSSTTPQTGNPQIIANPTLYECPKPRWNGFVGHCVENPCDKRWCDDYYPFTYILRPESSLNPGHIATKRSTSPAPAPANAQRRDATSCPPGTGYFQICRASGFRGCCTTDACSPSVEWCPDYKPFTYDPLPTVRPAPVNRRLRREAAKKKRNDSECHPVDEGYFQSCSNGFVGCCKSDACAGPDAYCPDAAILQQSSGSPGNDWKKWQFYQCSSNGFRGSCSEDPCNLWWCPDYIFFTYEPIQPVAAVLKKRDHPISDDNDDTKCAAGQGYFQSCTNGFRGCCRADACVGPDAYCPDPAIAQANAPEGHPIMIVDLEG